MTNPECPVLTIREHFAALALQGLLAAPMECFVLDNRGETVSMSKLAVEFADALITALTAPKESPK